MRKQNVWKRGLPLLLAAVMICGIVPQLGTKAYAAELPSATQFATADELKAFDTNEQNGTNPAKIYFGNNSQQWWIAGSQNVDGSGENSLTLFAASPLVTDKTFEPTYNTNKSYDVAWKCDYQDGDPAEVYPNHYGASPLRTELNQLAESDSYFTKAEQGLMKTTTVYTNDTENGKTYSTTDKLYLAYGGDCFSPYITVGKNKTGDLNGGLRVDPAYWGNGNFWLRAPNKDDRCDAMFTFPGNYVYFRTVSNPCTVVPAFELNLSSVIFASAAPAASSDGAMTVSSDAMTLRYKADGLGSAQVSFDKSTVNLTDVPADTYLVVQNREGAWAKSVSGTAAVSASDVDKSGTNLKDFANCKVWLETTNSGERKTYATMATEGANVKVTAGAHMTKTTDSGAAEQTNVTGAITDIVYTANKDYYFPTNYADNLSKDGITVTRNSASQITVSGRPTAKTVLITLPDAPAKTAAAPTGGKKATLKAPKAKLSKTTYSSATVTWNKVSGAKKYQVYRAASKNGKYSKVKTTSKTSWTNKKLTTGKTYYYKVRAVKKASGKNVYSKFSGKVKAVPRRKAPAFSLKAGNNSIKASWKKADGADGYRIYRAKTQNGKYKMIKDSRSALCSYTSLFLTDKHTYYYKMRSYKVVKGKKVYSKFSKVKSIQTK